MPTDYRIAETNTFINQIEKGSFQKIYNKILNYVDPQLRTNPFYGPNIKKLKGDYSTIYRYRIGDYRLFYTVEMKRFIIFILSIQHRKDSY